MAREDLRPTVHFVLNVPAEQHAALLKLSKERDCSIQHLVRAGITGMTGVPDPTQSRRRNRRREELDR